MEDVEQILDVLYTLDYLCKQRSVGAKMLLLGGSGILLFEG